MALDAIEDRVALARDPSALGLRRAPGRHAVHVEGAELRDEVTLHGALGPQVEVEAVAAEVLGMPPAQLEPWLGRVAETQRRYGLTGAGAVQYRATWDGRLLDPRHLWWAQAEYLRSREATGQRDLWDAFALVRRFTFEKMVPRGSGAWISTLSPDGRPIQGMAWQMGYHVTRTLLECEATLDRLIAARSS